MDGLARAVRELLLLLFFMKRPSTPLTSFLTTHQGVRQVTPQAVRPSGHLSGHTSGRTDHQVTRQDVQIGGRADHSPRHRGGIPRRPVASVGRRRRAIGVVIHEPSVDGFHATIKQRERRKGDATTRHDMAMQQTIAVCVQLHDGGEGGAPIGGEEEDDDDE